MPEGDVVVGYEWRCEAGLAAERGPDSLLQIAEVGTVWAPRADGDKYGNGCIKRQGLCLPGCDGCMAGAQRYPVLLHGRDLYSAVTSDKKPSAGHATVQCAPPPGAGGRSSAVAVCRSPATSQGYYARVRNNKLLVWRSRTLAARLVLGLEAWALAPSAAQLVGAARASRITAARCGQRVTALPAGCGSVVRLRRRLAAYVAWRRAPRAAAARHRAPAGCGIVVRLRHRLAAHVVGAAPRKRSRSQTPNVPLPPPPPHTGGRVLEIRVQHNGCAHRCRRQPPLSALQRPAAAREWAFGGRSAQQSRANLMVSL